MVRLIPALFLLLFVSTAWGQVEELPELQAEVLQDNWLQKLYDELDAGKAKVSCNSRIRIYPDFYTTLLSLQGQDREAKLNLNLSSGNEKQAYANFQLQRSAAKATLRDFRLGSISSAWGMGLVLKQNNDKSSLFRFGNASNPDYVTPLGVGGVFSAGKASAFVMMARQARPAGFKNGSISTLYTAKREDKSKVMESLITAGAELGYKAFKVGALGYYQAYDYPFYNPEYSKNLDAFSITAKFSAKQAQADCEAALIKGKPAVKAVLELSQAKLQQTFGLAWFSNPQFPAYAAKSGILSSKGMRSELSWDVDFPLSKNLDVSLRNALSRKHSSLQSPVWVARNILYLNYTPKDTRITLQLSRYNRELIAYTDSTYLATLPVHYRCNIRINQSLNKHLEASLAYRYYYEDQLSKRRNSFYWENALKWTNKAITAQAGVRSWQSMYSIAIPDANLGEASGISFATSEDSQVFGSIGMRLKSFHLDAELRQSWLDASRSIYINLGM